MGEGKPLPALAPTESRFHKLPCITVSTRKYSQRKNSQTLGMTMKMNLYLKLNKNYFCWLADQSYYGSVQITNDLMYIANSIHTIFSSVEAPEAVYLERPFFSYNNKLGQELRTQRFYGMILYMAYNSFPATKIETVSGLDALQFVYTDRTPSKDEKLSEARVFLKDNINQSVLSLFCLHDCLILKKYIERK